jgi:CubicO group peptidase (beta-lactamase class C family)
MPRSAVVRLVQVLALGALGACGGNLSGSGPPPDPVAADDGWLESTPAGEGLDGARLDALGDRIARGGYGSIDAVLVARHGRIAWERYFNGWTKERAHTLQSVSKSVTSLLAGIAVDDGRLAVAQPAMGFFPDYQPIANLDDRKRAMRVEDLLTMRTGMDWSENPYEGSPLQQLNESTGDWVRFVADWPMREQPGTRWEYVSGGVILLGGIVGRAVGERVDSFAADRLFEPLAMRGYGWYRNPGDGFPHTGGGLLLRPRDALKVGQLVLDHGRWNGRQIVSEAWIAASTRRLAVPSFSLGRHAMGYGYLWWIGSLDDPLNPRSETGDVIVASGTGGQWIFVVPRYDLVMVANGWTLDGRWTSAYDFLFTDVLPAVHG